MKRVMILCALVATGAAGYWAGHVTTASAASTNVYEIQHYFAAPGKFTDLDNRFREHSETIMERHHIHTVAYLVAPAADAGGQSTIYHITEYASRDEAKKQWDEFHADPEWQKTVKDTEANGKIVDHVETSWTTPADYTPATALLK